MGSLLDLFVRIGANADDLRSGLSDSKSELNGFAEFAEDIGTRMAEIFSFAAIGEGVKKAFEEFASVDKATIALGALTGSVEYAEQSIARLKTMAMDEALSLPELINANQRLIAFGVNAKDVPSALVSIANASAATNTGIDSTSNAFERIVASGMAGSRQLVALGLTTDDLAKAMGVSAGKAQELFKAMDETQRIAVLTAALDKFNGVADKVANSASGSIDKMETAWSLAFEEMGRAIAPVATALANLTRLAAEGAQSNFAVTMLAMLGHAAGGGGIGPGMPAGPSAPSTKSLEQMKADQAAAAKAASDAQASLSGGPTYNPTDHANFGAITGGMNDAQVSAAVLAETIKNQESAMRKAVDALASYGKALDPVSLAMDTFAARAAVAEVPIPLLTKSTEDMAKSIKEGAAEFKPMAEVLASVPSPAAAAAKGIKDLDDALKLLHVADSPEREAQVAQALQAVAQAYGQGKISAEQWAAAQKAAINELSPDIHKLDEQIAGAMNNIAGSVARCFSNFKDFGKNVIGVFKDIERQGIKMMFDALMKTDAMKQLQSQIANALGGIFKSIGLGGSSGAGGGILGSATGAVSGTGGPAALATAATAAVAPLTSLSVSTTAATTATTAATVADTALTAGLTSLTIGAAAATAGTVVATAAYTALSVAAGAATAALVALAAASAPTTAQQITDDISMFGFASGTNYVPHDMVARIHKSEVILNASDSSIFRAMGGMRGLLGRSVSDTPATASRGTYFDFSGAQFNGRLNEDDVMNAVVKAARRVGASW